MLSLTKDMETGVELIDTQHRELVSRINHLRETGEKSASNEEVKKTMDYLGDYVVKHFHDEEELQEKSKYPRYPEHKKIHTLFVEDFVKLKGEFEKKGTSLDFILELDKILVTWIVKHIKGEDVEFSKFYKKQAL